MILKRNAKIDLRFSLPEGVLPPSISYVIIIHYITLIVKYFFKKNALFLRNSAVFPENS